MLFLEKDENHMKLNAKLSFDKLYSFEAET